MKSYIYSNQGDLFGKPEVVGYGTDEFYIKEIDKKLSKDVIKREHYSHKVCPDGTTHIHLGAFIKGEMLGVLQLGYAMNPRSCDKIVRGTDINEYKELNRMWLDDRAERNSESRAISYTVKYIKAKFPRVKWIQSFADERCGGLGIVYQAANFKFYGEHTSEFWEFDGEVYHNIAITNGKASLKAKLENRGFYQRAKKISLRQFRYIYFINQKSIKDCLLEEKPYPKWYKENTCII